VIRALGVDDEPLARERVSAFVRETDGLELAGDAGNGLEALDLIAALAPDVAFIDVEMPELSGFGVVAALRGARVTEIVFVTAYEHYALKAFDVGAVDYLHKPVTRPRFLAAVERVRWRLEHARASQTSAVMTEAARAERARGHRAQFIVLRGTTHHIVRADEVDWIDVADNYLRLHVAGRAHLSRGTMKDAEEELDPSRFVRVHRSAMVAHDRVASVRSVASGVYEIELRDGTRVRSSRGYADRVREMLSRARGQTP
jgi:two-component system LytT family response regulator